MQINSIGFEKKSNSNQTFEGIRSISTIVLPIKPTKKLEKITLKIKDGFYEETHKTKQGTYMSQKGIAKLTEFFNGDKLVGFIKKFTDGSYHGARTFKDGISIEYSSGMGNKVGTTVRKKGKFLMHSTGNAYVNGKPNIMTRKEVANLEKIAKESSKKALTPEQSAQKLREIFGKK